MKPFPSAVAVSRRGGKVDLFDIFLYYVSLIL